MKSKVSRRERSTVWREMSVLSGGKGQEDNVGEDEESSWNASVRLIIGECENPGGGCFHPPAEDEKPRPNGSVHVSSKS